MNTAQMFPKSLNVKLVLLTWEYKKAENFQEKFMADALPTPTDRSRFPIRDMSPYKRMICSPHSVDGRKQDHHRKSTVH